MILAKHIQQKIDMLFRKKKIKKYKIFFSWQSDIPGQREVIKQELLAQAYRLEEENECHIEIDEDTRSVPGMIPIADSVLEKIRMADIFVCDISPVASISRKDKGGNDIPDVEKKMPNSNVMFELGYAMRSMHSSRIIAVANTKGHKWHDGEMPFDIFNRQYVKFTGKDDLDLAHQLNLSYRFVRKYGRVDVEGHQWLGRLKKFFVEEKDCREINVPSVEEFSTKIEFANVFSHRLSLAFPGIKRRYFKTQEAINRLKIFFEDKKVLQQRMFVLEDSEGYSNPIDFFEVIDDDTVLVGQDIIRISCMEINRTEDLNLQPQIEVNALSMDQVDYDDAFQDNQDEPTIDCHQCYSIYTDDSGKDHVLTKQLHEDKAVFLKDGTWVSLEGKSQLRRICLYSSILYIRPRMVNGKTNV